MREQMKRAMVFGLAVMLAAPAAQIVTQQDALAGPFDTLSGSRSGGKRTHKQKSKKDKKQASSKKKSSSRKTTRTTTRTTTTNRTSRSTPTRRSTSRTTATTRRRVDDRRTVRCTSSGRCDNEPRAVGNTTRRPVNSRTTTTTRTRRPVNSRTTRTTTTRRPVSRTTTHRRTTYRTSRPVSRTHRHHSSSTTVHNHYYSNNSTNTRYYGRSTRSGGAVTTSALSSQGGATGRGLERELYVTGGMGLSGMSATQITDAPMPGLDFNVGVGAKRRLLVGELGFGLSGYRLDPEMAANTADMTLVSLTGDVKLQPRLAFIEPYISAGLGGHVFNDHIIDEGAVGASLRLGAGVDLRFDTVAVSAQYQRNFLGLVGDDRIYEDGAMSANTETLGLGLKIYF